MNDEKSGPLPVHDDVAGRSEITVSVIILNLNRVDDTLKCIDSVLKSDYSRFRIVVLDNGSEGNDADTIRCKQGDGVDVITEERNVGVARGWNRSIEFAKANHMPEYIFLLNNDTLIDSTVMRELVTFADANQDAGAMSPTVLQSEFPQNNEYTWLRDFVEPTVAYRLAGCALFIRTSVFDSIGVFDEDFFVYGEEDDFLQRMRTSSWLGYYVPTDGKVYHTGAATSSAISGFEAFHRTRNALLFYGKNKRGLSLMIHLGIYFISWLPSQVMADFVSEDRMKRISNRMAGLRSGTAAFLAARRKHKSSGLRKGEP